MNRPLEDPRLLGRNLPSLEEMPLTVRRADFRPDSFDERNMTVDAVITTFADVQRRDGRGIYTERLDRNGLDTRRIVGVPVLDGHRNESGRHTVGVIASVRHDANAVVATIRFSQADDAQPIITRVREGILRGVSIGYRGSKWSESTDASTGTRIKTALAWTIYEVSVVSIPADPGATIRSNEMDPEVVTEEPAVRTPQETERERRSQIRNLVRSAGFNADVADEHIDTDHDLTHVRSDLFERMQRRSHPTIRAQQVGPSNDDPNVIRTRREEAVYARMSGTAPTDAARPFMGDTLRDHVRAMLTMRGVSVAGMDADALFRAAMHTTSDFPQLLTGVGNRSLMAAYTVAASPLKQLARQTTLPDFRRASKLKLSDIGLLQEVSEAGEIKHTSRGEVAEGYSLKTYGTQFAISRKAWINDDLGAFNDWSVVAGRMAAETEANALAELLDSNPVMMEDLTSLFHPDHGNVADDGGPILGDDGDLSALSDARKALRDMKGLDGTTPINAVPKFLVVGTDQETDAEKALAAISAANASDANPFSGKLTLLVEPRLGEGQWYLFADPAILAVLEYAYLTSAQGPQMSSREGWDVLGMEFRVVLDFGCGAVDWRGAYWNPGV